MNAVATFCPATFAGEEFTRRRAAASRKVATRDLSATTANDLVTPWLALACRAGADLTKFAPELAEDLAEVVADGILSPMAARAALADNLCPRPQCCATLRSATSAAILRHEANPTPESHARGRGLMALSRYFRVGPITFPALPSNPVTAPAAQQPQGQTAARSEGRQAGSEESRCDAQPPAEPADAAPAPEANPQGALL